MSSSTKKQNRILLISLTAILAATAVLIAVTGSANKKKAEALPAETVETVAETKKTSTETKKETEKAPENSSTEEVEEKITGKTVEKKETKETEEKKDAEVAVVIDDVLPEFSSPVNGIAIKDYSDNVPVFSYTMEDYRVHNGVDFAASVGTPVCAAADGTVSEINDDPMMGVCVSLTHAGGAVTKYKGLSEESMSMVNVGDNVVRGQAIGSAGDTALIESAEENHVHFELTVNGEAQNPADYFKVTRISDLAED